jgi:hypothetical protein
MRQILEKHVSPFHTFKAACDTINRDKLLEAMKEFKIPQKVG